MEKKSKVIIQVLQMMCGHARTLPIFMAHGDADPVVAFENGKASVMSMRKSLGFNEVTTQEVKFEIGCTAA